MTMLGGRFVIDGSTPERVRSDILTYLETRLRDLMQRRYHTHSNSSKHYFTGGIHELESCIKDLFNAELRIELGDETQGNNTGRERTHSKDSRGG